MPPDEHDAATDAPNVPGDDIQPVRAASRVRILLGLPDDASENLVLSPPVPPVGFRYTEDRFIDEPDAIDPPLIAPEPQGVLVEENPVPPPTEETDIDMPDISSGAPDNAAAEETRRNDERARPIAVPPAPLPPEPPASPPPRTRLEIPGVSARPTPWPVFSDETAVEQDETAVEQTVHVSEPREPAAPSPPATLSPSDVASTLPSPPPLAAEAASATSEPPASPPPRTRLEIPGVSARPTPWPVFSDETTAEQTIDRASATITPAAPRGDMVSQAELEAYAKAPMIPPVMTSERSQPQVETDSQRLTATSSQQPSERLTATVSLQPPEHAATGTRQTLSSAGKAPRKNGFSLGPWRSVGIPTGRMSDSNTADERIEQLQQTVYELTTKLVSLQAQVNNQAQREQRHVESSPPERSAGRPEPTPPPPPRPVAISKRSAHQARPAQAFWVRRYLGRLHCRPLR
jgi:hypothetical protein